MEELYVVGRVTVNGESRAPSDLPAHQGSVEPVCRGVFGEDLSSLQAPRAPCTKP